MQSIEKKAEIVFQRHGRYLRMRDALKSGLSRYALYTLRDRGFIDSISRGIYRLSNQPPQGNPDLVTVSLRYPHAVICLVSALAFHNLTTQVPHAIDVAVPINARPPRPVDPPIRAHRFSNKTYHAGIITYTMDGIPVKMYNPEKTLADCFKFRNKIGMDVVLEALKLYKARRKVNIPALLKYAKLCRVESVMRPYLEAIL